MVTGPFFYNIKSGGLNKRLGFLIMRKTGILRSRSKISVSSNKAIIELDNDKQKTYYFKRKSISQLNVLNPDNRIIITSKCESKSFIKKVLGGGGVVFYMDELEICRITELNKYIIYNGKKYSLDIIKNDKFWKFSTNEFSIERLRGFGKLIFSYEEEYLFPCISCSVYLWSMYANQLS